MCRAAHRSWDVEDRQHDRMPPAAVRNDVRVSDDERQQVIDQLRVHTAVGRLTLDEFEARVGEAWAATNHGELRAVLRELPGSAPTPLPRPLPPPPAAPAPLLVHRSRGIPTPVLIALLVLVGSVLMSHFAWWLIPIGCWMFGARRRAEVRTAVH